MSIIITSQQEFGAFTGKVTVAKDGKEILQFDHYNAAYAANVLREAFSDEKGFGLTRGQKAAATHSDNGSERVFTADEVVEIANETSDSFGNLYRLDFIDRIRHEARTPESPRNRRR